MRSSEKGLPLTGSLFSYVFRVFLPAVDAIVEAQLLMSHQRNSFKKMEMLTANLLPLNSDRLQNSLSALNVPKA